ncbi:MAG TPA: glycosyltransferase [Chloroflexota bacterium]|nr:glycosyltransferase [Chloroflexota bacterium]
MTQTLPSHAPGAGLPAPDYTVGPAAAGRRPVTMRVDGDRVYGTLYEPTPAAARGRRVGVLVLEQLSWHRMHHRLARKLAAAGYYALTFDFRGRGESEGGDDKAMWERHHVPASMLADTRQAVATFRALVPLEHLVAYAYCQACHVAARCAREAGFEGLICAGATTIDEYFRQNYRGVLSGLPNLAEIGDLEMFEHLTDYDGALLFIHGERDLFLAASPLAHLAQRADAWSQAGPGREYEMCTVQGADHTFAARPHESIVIEYTLRWLDRRYGLGYPAEWQGPPPTPAPATLTRVEGPEDQVPLLATGAVVLPPDPSRPGEEATLWRLELPDGRSFGLTDSLRRLVGLIDGHRTVGEISVTLSAEIGHEVTPAQISRLLHERLAPLGVLVPDSRGEGDEEESGMTDILIRCYQPGDRLRALLDNLTRVTHTPYNVILVVGKRHAARNQNLALDRALTRYAVFLDDDVLLTEGWLERLRETMDRTGAGAVSGRQLGMDGRPLYTSAGCPEGAIIEAPIGGTCFMFRNDLGLRFDEAYVRSQWDDVDFMFQLYERGYKTYIDGRVNFYHWAEGKIWRNQNLLYFQEKWTKRGLLQGWVAYRYANGHIVSLIPSRVMED